MQLITRWVGSNLKLSSHVVLEKGIFMKTLTFILSFLLLPFANAAIGGLDLDVGHLMIEAADKSSNKQLWFAGHMFVAEKISIGAEFFQLADNGNGYTYSGSQFQLRGHSQETQQMGLRIGGFLSGASVDSFYGVISSGVARREVISSVDRSITQYSGYGAVEAGYQFILFNNFSIKTALVWNSNNLPKQTDFSGTNYQESITTSPENEGGIRIALGATF